MIRSDGAFGNGLPDDTVSSLPQLFRYIVALVDNEILIEDLEGFPTLEVRHVGLECRGAIVQSSSEGVLIRSRGIRSTGRLGGNLMAERFDG